MSRLRSMSPAVPAVLLALSLGSSSIAAEMTSDAPRLEIDLRWDGACPSLLGCDTTIRFESTADTVEVAGPLDGTRGPGRRLRIPVPEGAGRLSLDVAAVRSQVVEEADVTSQLAPMTSCAVDLVVPSTGRVLIDAVVRWAPPEAGPGSRRGFPPVAAWTCGLVETDDAGITHGTSSGWATVLEPATVCVTTLGGTTDGCAAAIEAARAVRPAFAMAPLAIASLSCGGDELPRCAEDPPYAVAFATHDDGIGIWSLDTQLVRFGGDEPALSDLFRSQLLPGELWGPMLTYMLAMSGRPSSEAGLTTAKRQTAPARCRRSLVGWLRDDDTVVIVTADDAVPAVWPAGWSRRIVPEGFVIIDAGRDVVAREGQLLRIPGRMVDGSWMVCRGITMADAD